MKNQIALAMNALKLLTLACLISIGTLTLHADQKQLAGPKGGRLLAKTNPHAEFLVANDRTISINFYSEDLKPIAATTQEVTVIADTKDGKKTIEFEKKGDALVSKTKLPDGEGYNLIVQLKQSPDAKPTNFRFKFQTYKCGECQRSEYACICGH